MPHNRFYLWEELVKGATVSLTGSEHLHLSKVMRLREGEEIELINGKNILATALIRSISKKETHLEIHKIEKKEPSANVLTLALPLMKPSSLELTIEKCTEIGVGHYWIYPGELSDKKGLSKNQLERLHKLMIGSVKQCGRLDMPSLSIFDSLESLPPFAGKVFYGDTKLQGAHFKEESSCLFFSGPEKGFSKTEIEMLEEKYLAEPLVLNAHILRAETAPLVFSSLFFG